MMSGRSMKQELMPSELTESLEKVGFWNGSAFK